MLYINLKTYIFLIFLSINFNFFNAKIFAQSAQEFYKQGNLAFQQQDFTKAIAEYNQAINADKSFAPAHHNLGSVYYLLGEPEKALQYFDQAIKLAPKDVENYNSRGALFLAQRNFKNAEKDVQTALNLNTKSPKTQELLGLLRKAQNKKEEACKAWQEAKKLGSKDAEDYLEKYCGIKKNAPVEVKTQNPTDKKLKTFEDFMQAGNKALEQRAYKDALSHFEKATQLNKKSPDAFFGLGGAYHALGNYDSACKAWQQAKKFGHTKVEQMMEGVCDK